MTVSDFIQFGHNDDERIEDDESYDDDCGDVKVHQGELSKSYKFTAKRVLN